MIRLAFKDEADGYYEVEVLEGEEMPAWTKVLTPTALQARELPVAPRTMTSLEFLDLFTEAEQLAVCTAAMADPQVNLWWTKLTMATFVDFADPRLVAGLDALVGAGLLTQARREEIVP